MSKKSTKALASAALMSLVLTTALSAGPVKAAQGKVTRVSGADRYATASQVATTNWESGSDSVVLVSGEGYADAVSASALAKKLGAPILLTEPGSLNADAQKALDTLKPKNVYVIGGNASISQSIRDGLKDKYTLTELGGANRYETNAAVADELVKLGVDASNVLVVGGEGFSDALSVAPVAAAKGQILLLATNDQAKTQPVIDFVKKNNSKATVVGTKNIINDTIYNALGASSRVDGGADRFATNIKVLNNFQGDLKSDKVYIANASKATPDNLYADALVASAVAGKYSAPLVLVDKDGTAGTDNAIAYLKDNTTSSTDFQVIGGLGVVPQAIEDDINAIYNPTPNGDQASEVESIESVGLNQIKVTFNGEVDSDTAEDESYYKVNGTSLTDTNAHATLQDNNKTVLITLADKQKQNDDVDVTVKKGILSADKSNTISEFTQTVTFSDTTVPTVDSVEARGNNKLTVKFSEPVKIGNGVASDIDDGDAEISGLSSFLSKFKIDDQNIANFGLDSQYSLAKNTVSDGHNLYSDEIEFYFTSSLSNGSKTLKISDGDDNILSDAAAFPFKETSVDFDVDTLTTKPEIQSITASDDKVYINFDRPMDSNTAQLAANYEINGGSTEYKVTKAVLKKDDTQVKLSVSKLNKGSNTVYISNKVKDAYGNKVADDTYKSFELEEDETKPSVNSVSVLNNSTIRVRFSKDVDAMYAVDTSNYKLKDNDGTDISNYISAASDATDYQDGNTDPITIPGNTKSPVEGDTTDVVDIHLSQDGIHKYKLTESKYTITIKNIQDRASTPNVIDDYVQTFDGSDDVAPEVEGNAIGLEDSDFDSSNPYRKVVVSFNKAMDASSLTDTDNYKFKNGSGDTVKLPSGTSIDTSSDNKSAIIKFPSAYGTQGKSGDNLIDAISVIGVKDENGNDMTVSQTVKVVPASDTATTNVKPNSINVKYNNDDLNVNLSFDKSIDNLNASDFKVQAVTPDSAHKNADGSITLVYKDGNPGISTIKLAGLDAQITTVQQASIKTTDVNGSPIKEITNTPTPVTPYGFTAAPKTYDTDNWNATLKSDGTKEVEVKFDTPIDSGSVNKDDFTFAIAGTGTTLKAGSATVNGSGDGKNTVVFTFDSDDNSSTALSKFVAGASLKVTPRDNTKISTEEDKNDEYGYYTRSSDDKDGYIVVINGNLDHSTTAVSTTYIVDNTAKTIDLASATPTAGDLKTDLTSGGQKYTVAVFESDGTTPVADTANVAPEDKVVITAQDGYTSSTYALK
ncbi:cell wall-binding repeat-containing protein [Clostridium sp. HV4-5-A1G]|uniref:cell wall-binding repeat-containing protein n=1 Tax=Clostridium sp. HV4-5-A1G TaxID=2004595 RepID=UPI00123C7A05|nr:cell wall-binding repeat-containing protein [Clostridium sp. HV4-5-A1G]KAA8669561.1 hypothetical protein F3O63_13300 [Clostridium sp. HV4-5-A1G]